jgi:DNA repair protein RecO (recombination protein O)
MIIVLKCKESMWSTVKTTGVVLTMTPFREVDRRYSALTSEYGKIEFIGRGAQKPKAKLASHLEPFSIVHLEIVHGARSTTVIGVERAEAFGRIRSNLEHRLFTQTLFAMLEKAVRPDLADPELFQEIVDVVRFLDTQESMPQTRGTFLLGAIILRLLRRLGYDVELRDCLSCRTSVMPLSFRWHGGRGGLVCSDCVQANREDWFAARPMDDEIITLMRLGRDTSFTELIRFPLKGDHVEQFAQCVHDVYTYHVPGEISMPFWVGIQA